MAVANLSGNELSDIESALQNSNLPPGTIPALIAKINCMVNLFGSLAACETAHGETLGDTPPWSDEFTGCVITAFAAYENCMSNAGGGS